MKGYIIFSLKKAIGISINTKLKKEYKYTYFLTDRVIIFNLLRKEKLKVILLQDFLNQREFNRIFLENYEKFNLSLKKMDEQSIEKINLFYNTFRYLGPRDYVGIICMTVALKNILKKYKFKKFILFLGFRGAIFHENIYVKIFNHFCNINKINFCIEKSERNLRFNFLKIIYNFLSKFKIIISNFNFLKLNRLVKKYLTKIKFFKKKNSILIIEPAFDLNYLNYQYNNTFFKDFDLGEKVFSDHVLQDFNQYNKKNTFLKIVEDHLKYNIVFNIELIRYKTNEILKFVNQNRVKKIFWGVTPNPLLANILDYIKNKKIKIYGTQHGGKYLIQKDDIYHKDSDYSFCDVFLAYGVSKEFKKKKFSPKTKIINIGSFKSIFLKKEIQKNKQAHLTKNLLYIPISSSFFIKPFYGLKEINHYLRQTQICNFLNKMKSNKNFVKVISQPIKFGQVIDELSLEHNPLNFDIASYRNLKTITGSISNALKELSPRVIICDSLSTPVYEMMLSNSEIILFLDPENLPKKDVMSLISKRVFLVKTIKEMRLALVKINQRNKLKAKNEEFIKKFYLTKTEILQYK